MFLPIFIWFGLKIKKWQVVGRCSPPPAFRPSKKSGLWRIKGKLQSWIYVSKWSCLGNGTSDSLHMVQKFLKNPKALNKLMRSGFQTFHYTKWNLVIHDYHRLENTWNKSKYLNKKLSKIFIKLLKHKVYYMIWNSSA